MINFNIKCAEKPIPISSEVKLLGVTLDNKLKFDSRIACVAVAFPFPLSTKRHARALGKKKPKKVGAGGGGGRGGLARLFVLKGNGNDCYSG